MLMNAGLFVSVLFDVDVEAKGSIEMRVSSPQ